ncbi:MAG: leucyl aminopeptidase family protein [Pseudomonadota bacterium]
MNIDNFDAADFFALSSEGAIKTYCVTKETLENFIDTQNEFVKNQIIAHDFKGKEGKYLIFYHDADSTDFSILAGYKQDDLTSLLYLGASLPDNISKISLENLPEDFDVSFFAELWAADHYRFTLYKKNEKRILKLLLPDSAHQTALYAACRARQFGRNAVNLPAEICTPAFLQKAIEDIAEKCGAECKATIGSDLQDQGYRLIHAVGRAVQEEDRLPRLVHLKYNADKKDYPHLALVGKGVTFDTGGLNIKTGSSMSLMKKDMGGAASVMSLAYQIMLLRLPLRLDLYVPTVENNVSGNAMRPSDVFTAYNGKTVEITNTDAEGRLILADALSLASETDPDLLIDIATLTGAARVAVGPDLSGMFTDDDMLAENIFSKSNTYRDPVWRLPLYAPYLDYMKGTISDLVNSGSSGFAGASTAALFLKEFVKDKQKWVHFDSYCWNKAKKSGKPKGGDVAPIRALFHYIKDEFIKNRA